MSKVTLIDLLPNDMLTTIFEFLKPKELVKVTRVCKKWLSLIRSNVRLYKRFILSTMNLPVQLDMLKELKEKYRLARFAPNPEYFKIADGDRKAEKIKNDRFNRGIFAQDELKRGSKISFEIGFDFAMIGVAPKEVDQSLEDHFDKAGGGWYLYCDDGTLFCKDLNFYSESYHNRQFSSGSVVSVELSESGDIVFYENGVSLGVAFCNITQPVIPAVLLFDKNVFVEIVHNSK